jgi:hypothetical protein
MSCAQHACIFTSEVIHLEQWPNQIDRAVLAIIAKAGRAAEQDGDRIGRHDMQPVALTPYLAAFGDNSYIPGIAQARLVPGTYPTVARILPWLNSSREQQAMVAQYLDIRARLRRIQANRQRVAAGRVGGKAQHNHLVGVRRE